MWRYAWLYTNCEKKNKDILKPNTGMSSIFDLKGVSFETTAAEEFK